MRAIMSVANREGLLEFARELQSYDVTIFSTGSTLSTLRVENIPCVPVSSLTVSPETLGGQAELLHPAIVGGILAPRDVPHDTKARKYSEPIDVVVINFSPFAEIVAHQSTTLSEALAQIEVGGATLVRAAAKNFQDVLVLVRPQDYIPVMQEWREQGEVSMETRRRLATIAFQHVASYDSAIAEYLRIALGEHFSDELTLPLECIQTLRYGENPHQQAALYRWTGRKERASLASVAGAEVLQGRELSYNNLLDLDVALMAVQSFTAPTVAIIKHTNPSGLACDDVLVEAYKKAHAGDPISAFGGVIGCNRPVDEAVAHEVTQLFYDAVIAPEFLPVALGILRQQKNLRLLATHCPVEPGSVNTQLLHAGRLEVRSISGGLLVQTPDGVGGGETEYQVVSEREPTLDEVTDLLFAWKVARCVKSNAIVLAHKLTVVGVGAGQMHRATSVQLAVEKAGPRVRGSVLASDAFFPFADGIKLAAKEGVTAIIQPGGSIRDEEAIRMANRYALAMIFTGKRHFRH